MITEQELRRLKRFVGGNSGYGVYNILSAIRGNDKPEQIGLKAWTKVIRSYIGFKSANMSGDDIGYVPIDELDMMVKHLEKDTPELTDPEKDGQHYPSHLDYAINSLGKYRLLKFMRAEIARRRKQGVEY